MISPSPSLWPVSLSLCFFLAQALIMAIDEFVCHHKRGLGRWESWGHPLDTLFFALCFAELCVRLKAPEWALPEGGYLVLAVLSSVLITKDEWVHSTEAGGFEHWLHSLLFVLHPLVLISAFQLSQDPDRPLILSIGVMTSHENFLFVSFFMILGFMFYQLIYWVMLKQGRQRLSLAKPQKIE